MIKTKFVNCTVFTIAHRLTTIADSDRVLVMNEGKAAEFDNPYKLLVKNVGDDTITNEDGFFAKYVLQTGTKTSQMIFDTAKEAYKK
eukprot:CAMPEP_0114581648 /NCGR_PEP_ID=MMETSP0125-20121206/5733_1 /TAXON_ID=485358 ORGANISM="Aristerostoma sp., Strain ATCC 50986" /NCGR_SAMPLE_ID=MMETSP0125 /ASSEMBLY_ACC=CAM_ASM_000245 /LENGTH=86 /DNA_ID=CAMNT_0001774019 /DNA_START=3647 /DNA_END=3910 /DNA_ORIENTATION=-